jgi:cell division protein FtsX
MNESPLPEHSVWPVVLAGGIALLLFGVVTSFSFSVLGALLIVGALTGWIGDLLHVRHD